MKEEWKTLQHVVQDKRKKLLRLREVEKLIETESNSFNSIQQQYNKEHKDVEKLTKPSLTNIFYTLNGKKEEQLQKEQSELDDITEKVTKKNEELTLLKEEQLELMEQLKLMEEAEKKQDQLAAIVEEKIKRNPSSNGYLMLKQVDKKTKEVDELDQQLTRIETLIDTLLRSTIKSKVLLESAKTLGIVAASNVALSMVKQTKLKEAQEQLRHTMKIVDSLKQELDTFHWDGDILLRTDNFTLLLDVFMDNFFIDWKVQNDIKEALFQVKTLQEQTYALFEEVVRGRWKVNDKYEQLREQRFSIIELFM